MKKILYIFFIIVTALAFTFFGNNIGMWRINISSSLVEKEYGDKMEKWRQANLPGVESYKIKIIPFKLSEVKDPIDFLNTRVIVDYYNVEAWNITKDKLRDDEVLAKEFVFFVNPILNKIKLAPETEKTLKNY